MQPTELANNVVGASTPLPLLARAAKLLKATHQMLIKKLVILQPTPFCNIDCKYCYLPNRDAPHRMPLRVLERICHEVFKSKYFDDPVYFVWHSGEPLT